MYLLMVFITKLITCDVIENTQECHVIMCNNFPNSDAIEQIQVDESIIRGAQLKITTQNQILTACSLFCVFASSPIFYPLAVLQS